MEIVLGDFLGGYASTTEFGVGGMETMGNKFADGKCRGE
jgi:hypothetical protein